MARRPGVLTAGLRALMRLLLLATGAALALTAVGPSDKTAFVCAQGGEVPPQRGSAPHRPRGAGGAGLQPGAGLASDPSVARPERLPHGPSDPDGAGLQPCSRCELVHGGIVRGDAARRRLALVFTAHEYAEGAGTILSVLAQARARASFFLTGDFLRTPAFAPIVRRLTAGGHYIGPHSDRHLLYCDWTTRDRTLVTSGAFDADVRDNLRELERFGLGRATIRYWIPAYEWYNREVASWSERLGLRVVSFTPGTRANADYTSEADTNFVSSAAILESIRARESADPHGLNGFVLLLHLGAGPGRTDKFADRFGELVAFLRGKGYELVRLDTLLDSAQEVTGGR